MFKIEDVFCDDKKVGDVLRALAGLVVGIPKPIPMINAENVGGKIRSEMRNGSMLSVFLAFLSKHKSDRITPKEIGAWLKTQGRSSSSASYLVRQARDAGAVRAIGKGAAVVYMIVRALPKPEKK